LLKAVVFKKTTISQDIAYLQTRRSHSPRQDLHDHYHSTRSTSDNTKFRDE